MLLIAGMAALAVLGWTVFTSPLTPFVGGAALFLIAGLAAGGLGGATRRMRGDR